MDNYEISRLTDFDFEAICKDLLQKELHARLELFAPGRDAGVDLRHYSPGGSERLIVQCKRWDRNAAKALYRHMRDKELPKIVRLAPSRYILATSVSLSKGAKDDMADLLAPFVVSPSDIFGLHEIESLLREHPDVVQRHLRLWLSSTAVMQAVLNKDMLLRSGDLATDIAEAVRLYVPNSSYRRAQEILERHNYCVIAGLPGIGKSMLAKVLCAAYAEAQFDIYEISEDVNEINDVWVDSVPQLFYYDDFLGQTTLADKLHKNEDSRLLRILRRISTAPNKRLILTTREYILESARQHYERLASADLQLLTCVINLSDYTKLIRAEILYNHVYFSDLSQETKQVFADPHRYRPIINHSNFSPRLIERSLSRSIVDGESGVNVADSLLANIRHPGRLWDHIVNNQLDKTSIAILLVLLSLDGAAHLPDIELAINGYVQGRVDGSELKRKLKILESTMIRLATRSTSANPFRNAPRIEYHNPSIRDYMRDYVGANPDIVQRLISTAIFFEQLISLWETAKGRDGHHILASVYAHKDLMAESLMRTYEQPPPRAVGHVVMGQDAMRLEADFVKRLRFLVELCEETSDDHLVAYTAERIDDFDLGMAADDGSLLASTVRTICKSPIEKIARYGPKVLSEAVEWITGDLYDWNNIVIAHQALEDLGDIAPEEVRTEIEEAYDREALNWMERFEEDEEIASRDVRNVQDIVRRAESLLGPVAAVQKARLVADEMISEMRRQTPQVPKVEPKSEGDVDGQIHEILGSLRTD